VILGIGLSFKILWRFSSRSTA